MSGSLLIKSYVYETAKILTERELNVYLYSFEHVARRSLLAAQFWPYQLENVKHYYEHHPYTGTSLHLFMFCASIQHCTTMISQNKYYYYIIERLLVKRSFVLFFFFFGEGVSHEDDLMYVLATPTMTDDDDRTVEDDMINWWTHFTYHG